VRRHGRLNTCAGCLPKVTGVQRLLPVLAARQKSPPETAAEGKFLTAFFDEALPAGLPIRRLTPS